MKKVILIFLGVVVALIVFWVLFNFFDAGLDPGMFTESDLRPATWDKSNGYYVLLGLTEPAEVDVQSEEYRAKVRRLFAKAAAEKFFDSKENRKKFAPYKEVIRDLDFPTNEFRKEWPVVSEPRDKKLEKARETCALILKRYELLIAAPVFEDFSIPRVYSPIIDRLGWIYAAGVEF